MTATLQMLLDEGIGLRCECRNCKRLWVLDAEPLANVLGAHQPIVRMPIHIVCEECQHIGPEVRPDWPSKGQEMVKPIP